MYTFEADRKKSYQHGKELFEARVAKDDFDDDELDMIFYIIGEATLEVIKTLRQGKMISKKDFKKLKKDYKEVAE